MRKILFVCHGNICRSAMAKFIMKDLVHQNGLDDLFYIDSAATSREEIDNDMYPPAKRCLREHGVPFDRHYARQITRKDYDTFDEIYVMDSNNQRNIKRIIPNNPKHKIHKLRERDIADPWYTDNFERTYNDLMEGCKALLEGPSFESR